MLHTGGADWTWHLWESSSVSTAKVRQLDAFRNILWQSLTYRQVWHVFPVDPVFHNSTLLTIVGPVVSTSVFSRNFLPGGCNCELKERENTQWPTTWFSHCTLCLVPSQSKVYACQSASKEELCVCDLDDLDDLDDLNMHWCIALGLGAFYAPFFWQICWRSESLLLTEVKIVGVSGRHAARALSSNYTFWLLNCLAAMCNAFSTYVWKFKHTSLEHF